MSLGGIYLEVDWILFGREEPPSVDLARLLYGLVRVWDVHCIRPFIDCFARGWLMAFP